MEAPHFLIFSHNAPELASMVMEYLDQVDGTVQEDIYYGHDEDDVGTPTSATAELEQHLDRFRERGKLVLTIDYATLAVKVDDAYVRPTENGHVPFVTTRELDRLTVDNGDQPD